MDPSTLHEYQRQREQALARLSRPRPCPRRLRRIVLATLASLLLMAAAALATIVFLALALQPVGATPPHRPTCASADLPGGCRLSSAPTSAATASR